MNDRKQVSKVNPHIKAVILALMNSELDAEVEGDTGRAQDINDIRNDLSKLDDIQIDGKSIEVWFGNGYTAEQMADVILKELHEGPRKPSVFWLFLKNNWHGIAIVLCVSSIMAAAAYG